ncbi:MAG: hypothetical protein JG775_895 [Defluviitaleaceae bacterium]|jgi:rubrerythrin|nr:hypothetical protein [Defluviitaleaceae bacterium]
MKIMETNKGNNLIKLIYTKYKTHESGGGKMELTTQDYLKKALLDTQERIRDFQNYSQIVEDEEISDCFKRFAENEGLQASELQKLISKKLGQ